MVGGKETRPEVGTEADKVKLHGNQENGAEENIYNRVQVYRNSAPF